MSIYINDGLYNVFFKKNLNKAAVRLILKLGHNAKKQ